MRLIDADALKEEVNKKNVVGRFNTIMLIDNAPTVTPEKVLIANVTFDEDKLKDIVQTEVIDKIKSGELVLKAEERPQGEITNDDIQQAIKEGFDNGYEMAKEKIIHSIAKQYSEHNELVPIWLSIGDIKDGAE